MWGVRGRALSHPRLPALWAGCRGPLPTGCGCGGGAGVGARLSLAPCPVLRLVVCCARFPGSRHPVAVVVWHLFFPPWLWPAACLPGVPRGPALVRRSSSVPVALGAPIGFPVAVVPSPTPGPVAPGFTWWLRGARGCRPRTGLIVHAAGPCRGKGAGRAPRRTCSGPRDGVVPGGSLQLRSWAACAAVVWRVWTRSLTRPVSRTVRLATGDSAGAPGLFRVDADTAPFGSEDATPGSRACVRVRALLGRPGRAGLPGAFWCPSLFLWPLLVRSLLDLPPPGWGCPVCGCCWVFFNIFFVSFPLLPLVAPLLCPALRVFRPRVPWALASCPPHPLFFSLPPLCAPRCLLLCVFPGLGALGLGVLLPPAPFSFCFCPPPSLLSLAFPAFGLPWASAPPLPPPFFFPFPWFLVLFLFGFFFLLFFSPPIFTGCAVRGGFVCLGPSGVPRWCCPCRCSVCAGLCSVVLAVGPGCPLLSPGGSWCRASVVLSLSGRVARGPVVRRGVSWCSAALCCVLLRGAVVWWCAVVLCRLFASLLVPVVCFLPLRVCCVCSGVSCCVFPVLLVRCAVRVVCAVSGGWCCWFLVSLPFVRGLLVALVARPCCLVVCAGSGARVWSGCRWASSLWCPVPLCCVLWRCAAVWCCVVLPCLLFLFFSLLVALVSCYSPLVLGSGPVAGRFCFCALPVRCCAGVPASLLSVWCSLALAGLAGVLCCCLLCLCGCCWAWLSPVVSLWVLVAPGVVSRGRAVVCPWVLCCAVLLRVVPPGVALLCAVLFCFAPLGAAARCVVSWGAVCRLGDLCLLAPCFVLSPRAVCVLLWCVAGGVVRRCALCRVRPGVLCCAFPVASALCGDAVWPAFPRCPAPLCCAPSCCAAAWCRAVLSCRLFAFFSCVGVVVPT